MSSSASPAPGSPGGVTARLGRLRAILAYPWWQRITFRLLLLVLAVSTVPPLTLGILAMRSARVAQEREVRQQNRAVARWGVDKVQSYLGNITENMRLLTELGDLQSLDPATVKALFSFFISFMEDVKEISLLDAAGQERVRVAENVLVTPGDLVSQADALKFQVAFSGETYVGPVRTSEFSEPFLTVALPIRNLLEDRVVGVLAVEVNLKRLWDDVLSFKVGQSGYLYLVNGAGQLLAHPDFSLVLGQREAADFGAVERFLKRESEEHPGVSLEYPNYQGRPVIGVYARSQNLGWGVIVEQPVAEAFANVNRMKVETTLILINTLMVTLVLAMLSARGLTRPLAELAEGARRLGTGDFGHPIPVRGRDELAEVAGAFNWMRESLRQNFQGLRTLLESTTRLAGVGRREEVLRLAVDETTRVVGGVQCAVLLLEASWDGERPVRAQVWEAGSDGPKGAVVLQPGATHPVARVLSGREVVTTEAGAVGLPRVPADRAAPTLIVPLLAGPHLRGALVVIRSGAGRTFGETEVMLCQTLANHLSIALQLREAHEQLVRAEKLRAVGEIAAGVAHNFNNVLGGILARAQLLQLTTDPAELRKGLQIIERATLDGAGIVRRLQNSARLQTAKPLTPVALDQVVRDALELTRPRWKDAAELRGKPIVVENRVPELPVILGDPTELREVVTNILLNAVEAMPDGGRLRAEATVWGGAVTLTFSDTGVGMSEEVRRRIFDPFFTTKGTRGTGLGMSVSYATVKRHGGEIAVDSVLGQGTIVRLRFPVRQTAESPAPAAPAAPAASPSVRILLVDDDAYVRETLRDVLVSLGHRVEAVDSGQQALERFVPGAFHIVITDLGMEVSGREVARTVKARSPQTPVILVTGWAADLDLEELRRSGVDLVLGKPFQVDEVREVIAKACASRAKSRV